MYATPTTHGLQSCGVATPRAPRTTKTTAPRCPQRNQGAPMPFALHTWQNHVLELDSIEPTAALT